MKAWKTTVDRSSVGKSLRLVVGWRNDHNLEGRQINVSGAVANALRASAEAALEAIRGRDPLAYDPDADATAEEVLMVPREALEPEPPIISLLENAETLDLMSARDLPEKPLLFYAVLTGGRVDQQLSFIRKTNPYLSAKPGRIFSILGDSLDRLEDPIFAFDDRFDLVLTSEGLVVFNTVGFEQLFRDVSALQVAVPKWIGEVTLNLPLGDASRTQLEQLAATSTRARRRLRSIYERGYLSKVGIAALRREMRRQGLNPADFITSGKIVVDREGAQALLEVLNEDLFTGGLSGTAYRVDPKSTRS
jgi:hypothetical protein